MSESAREVKPPDLLTTFARSVLIHLFQEKPMRFDLFSLHTLYAEEDGTDILDYHLRSQRIAISRILAQAFLQSISPQESDFLLQHYRKGKTIRWLSLRLPFSERQLFEIHARLLSHLSQILVYRLSLADAFTPLIPLNLASVLDMRLSTLAIRTDIPLGEGYVADLYEARQKAGELSALARSFLAEPYPDEYAACIAVKLRHPHLTMQELSKEKIHGRKLPVSAIYKHIARYTEAADAILQKKSRPVEKSAVFKSCGNLY